MPDATLFDHCSIRLEPDPSRTLIRPFTPDDPAGHAPAVPRTRRIVDRIAALDDGEVARLSAMLRGPLSERAVDGEALLLKRFEGLHAHHDLPHFDRARSIVAGAYFSQEYAFESAALFNPSVVLHDDQAGLPAGAVRLLLSLRGIGEGHVSSVTFRVLTWTPGSDPVPEPASSRAVTPSIDYREGETVRFTWPEGTDPSQAVLFPATPSQRQGLEDLRMVRFREDDGSERLFATYTAFSGTDSRPEMLEAEGPSAFTLRPLTGRCALNKGMALFPRRIGGAFAMLGRIDNENLYLMRSDDPYRWDEAALLLAPRESWEFVQIGNCGSPIEIDEGWLVLTHGVGLVRSYAMGAVLLDRDDPARVLARTRAPILMPEPEERGGYVPNVVYSCGALVHDRTLLLPYAVADRYATFASAPLDRVLAALEPV
jgi:predicted GH43/DUF377 family glycosyl hydrolase